MRNTSQHRRRIAAPAFASIAPLLIAGCASIPRAVSNDQAYMVSLLMPAKVEIVEPFTRAKSFNNDPTPDGIELLLQAVNSLDVPGRMMVGRLNVALFEYVPATPDRRGRQLDRWEIDLTTTDQQRRHWNRLTHMYELRLSFDPARVPPAERYVLQVTYNSPMGEHLSDQCLVDFPKGPGAVPVAKAGG
jgi:hypothetical protein